MNTLHIENLSFKYSQKNTARIFRDFSMTTESANIVALLGKSGCGKTTLLRLIAGLETPQAGVIRMNETVMSSPNVFVEPEKRGVGMVFQDYALFPHKTVRQNIAYGLHRLHRDERKKRVEEFLKLVDLEHHGDKYPFELSGGQQQRVALARSLSPSPKILLLDEPFSNLDANLREKIRSDVKQILHRFAILTVFVTHDRTDAEFLADKTVKLD